MSDTLTLDSHITEVTHLIPAIAAWKRFLDDQGRSLHTIKAFSADLQLLCEYLPTDKTIGAVSTDDLNGFVDWLEKGRAKPCSPKSLSRRITSIKSFFGWLTRFGVLSISPAEKVLQRSVISPLPAILSPLEVEQVYEAASKLRNGNQPDARAYCLFGMLLETGIKKGECRAVYLSHLDLADPQNASVFIRYSSPALRLKERKIKLSPAWVEAFTEYLQQYKVEDRVFNWSPRRLEYILEDLGVEAGLRKHLSFDMCRWTSVLQDWKSGVDHDTIRQKLGISKIQWREVSLKLNQLAEKSG
jgi:integrase/recombinase XerD